MTSNRLPTEKEIEYSLMLDEVRKEKGVPPQDHIYQPLEKWTAKGYSNASDSYEFVLDNSLHFEVTIPKSLIEQLQSEAVNKDIKDTLKIQADLQKAIEEARADERKKFVKDLVKLLDLMDNEDLTDAMLFDEVLIEQYSEQPVEYCNCKSATYYEQGILCEDCGKIGKPVEEKQ